MCRSQVFSENLFFGSSMSQETPTMDQMQESATCSKIVEALIRLNASLTSQLPVRQITDMSRRSLPSAFRTGPYAGAFLLLGSFLGFAIWAL